MLTITRYGCLSSRTQVRNTAKEHDETCDRRSEGSDLVVLEI
jgi:hypothetical protein